MYLSFYINKITSIVNSIYICIFEPISSLQQVPVSSLQQNSVTAPQQKEHIFIWINILKL
jgi:hypothetical protein